MPFELGIFFGAKKFGDRVQKNKAALIFDREQYRYQQYISDLNGVDIKAHQNNPHLVIRKVCDWLRISSRRTTIPGHLFIQQQHDTFIAGLPVVADHLGLEVGNIAFNDFCMIVEESIREIES